MTDDHADAVPSEPVPSEPVPSEPVAGADADGERSADVAGSDGAGSDVQGSDVDASDGDCTDAAKASNQLVGAQNTVLDLLRDNEVMRAQLHAADVRLLVQLGDLVAGQERWAELEQFVDLELAGTLLLGQTSASTRFCDAARLASALPLTVQLLEEGELFAHQAAVVLRKTRHCPEEVSQLVEARVLPEGAGLCPADLGRRIEAELLKVEGERENHDAERRRAAAVQNRRTFTRPEDDGMAVVGGYLPAEQARQWSLEMEILQRQEKAADQAAGVERTADQRRADVLAALPGLVLAAREAGLLQAAGATGPDGAMGADDAAAVVAAGCTRQRTPRIVINVHVPMATVLDLSQAPGVMTGYGLISAEHVRGLLPSADLRAINVDEVSGVPISVGALLRAGWDPTTGRLLPDPAQTPTQTQTEASKPPPTKRTRRSTEGLAAPNLGPPQSTFWAAPEPEPAPDDRDSEPTSPALVASARNGERLRDPGQIREALLSMIEPVWAVDRAEPQHDPSAALARLVDLRDQRCCGPGCSMWVGRTQRDHNLRWPDGPTAAWNLSVKSARCHRAKHAGWQVTIDAAGTARWVSPLGRVYDRPGVWERPPDLSAVRVLPAPRAAQSLSWQQNTPDDDDRAAAVRAAAVRAAAVRAAEHRRGEDHLGEDVPPPF